ncbi:MAG: carbon-nitrogen hydrolase family protein [Xanthomonadales bacterium]|nr:carbon-nitrogen hydrolase family protein [Xanthomonadales bacterium]
MSKSMEAALTAAVVQAAPAAFDLDATMDRVEHWCFEARAKGARLVVFPEAFLGGYPKGADFGVRVGMRSDQGRIAFQRYADAALTIPGAHFERLCQLVRELDIVLLIGAIERDGTSLYCSALTIDRSGLLARHRKIMPTAMERVIWANGDGSSIAVHPTPVGRIGAAICWENYMPQLRMRLYQQQVELYCAPTVDDRDSWIHSMRHIACEGRCFVLSACQYALRGDYPADYQCIQGDAPDTVLIRGGSCIVDPFGNLLAGPHYGASAVLVAELDPQLIIRGKFDLDLAGHYARPDIFGQLR